MAGEKQHITLNIYGTQIPLNVNKDEEEDYRKASNLINDRLNAYFDRYQGSINDKSIIFYAMIDIARKCVREQNRNDVEPYKEVLIQLDSEIKEALK